MSRIMMVRHGETQWNADRRSQGWMDPPLNENGMRQAELAGEHIRAHFEFERVISSDLTRCTMTADRLRLDYSKEPMLREINTGAFAGLLIDDIEKRFSDVVDYWERDIGRAPDGESWLDLAARAGSFVAESGILEIDGDVCLVSHGGTIRALLSVFLGLNIGSVRNFAQNNTGITIVSHEMIDGEPSFGLELLNSTEHLRSDYFNRGLR